ncbi:hypothetical protein JW979_10775 [bacterium]|nr:hypothetical protein [candidate division CSSED10-310 bacterium]
MPYVSIFIWITAGLVILFLMDLYQLGGRFETDADLDASATSNIISRQEFSRNVIITHLDFDGLTCGALLLRHLGMDSNVVFTSAGFLHRAINRVMTVMTRGDTLTIADLALPSEYELDTNEMLSKLIEKGVTIIWYDHHQWPAGLKERIGGKIHRLEIDTTVRTAAEIIRKDMDNNDAQADRLMRFVQRGSLPNDKEWDRLWRLMLTEVVNQRDHDLAKTVLKTWAEDAPLNPALLHLARKAKKRERITETAASYLHPKFQTQKNRSFIIVDTRPKRKVKDTRGRTIYIITLQQPTIMVGSLACRKHHADFCLIIWDDFRYSLYQGLDRSVDFSVFFPQLQLDTYTFSIAGHGYAASVRVKPSLMQRLKAFFCWSVPEAAMELSETLVKTL